MTDLKISPHLPIARQDILDAISLLNYILGDLLAGWHAFIVFQDDGVGARFSEPLRQALARMSLAQMALALAKWGEFYDKYHYLLPDASKESCKALRRDLHQTELRSFRNEMVGHAFSKTTGRPLRPSEMRAYLENLMPGSVGAFLHWIRRVDDSGEPNSVSELIRKTRDLLIESYSVSTEEIFGERDEGAA